MAFDYLLPFIQSYPKISIIIAALGVSLLISVINYFVLDKERMREIKKKQTELQEEMKKHKDNPQKMMELQKEMMSHMGETMKHSFKPMLITLIPILFIFGFMKNAFATTEIAKTWIWYYIGTSIVGSIIFRKLFNLP